MAAEGQVVEERPWPPDGLERVTECPVCRSPSRELLYEGLRDRLFGAPGLWTLHRCRGCGSAYLDPRPSRETVALAYERYFTHSPSKFDREATDGLGPFARARRAIANGYLNRRFGTDFRPASRLGGVLASFIPMKRHQLDARGRHLPRPWRGARLLDVGCGNGEFLAFAQRAGWEAIGVEPDERAVRIARERGVQVLLGGVEALEGAMGSFDVITLSHVIEHVHDPVNVLRRCRELLRPGGWLWMDTPNLASFGHQRYGEHWRGLEPPRHLVLFTWESLAKALAQAGFQRTRPAPWGPVAVWTFPVSEVIAVRGVYAEGQPVPAPARWRGLLADLRAVAALQRREFITVIARTVAGPMS